MLAQVNEWLKAATLEVQEYVRLCGATAEAHVTRPFYYRDIIQQFEQIGMGFADCRPADRDSSPARCWRCRAA